MKSPAFGIKSQTINGFDFMPKGGKRVGAGRKRESKNVRLAAREEAMRVAA